MRKSAVAIDMSRELILLTLLPMHAGIFYAFATCELLLNLYLHATAKKARLCLHSMCYKSTCTRNGRLLEQK